MLREHHILVRRSARYYTLGDPVPSAREVVYAFHGYGQLAGRFIAKLQPVADSGRLVVAPEALSRFYIRGLGSAAEPQVGASWMTREDREGEIEDQRGFLDALHAEIAGAIDGGTPGLSLLGFSQGVATLGRWLAAGGERPPPRTVVLWAGKLPVELDAVRLSELLGGSRVFVVVGDSDSLAPAQEVRNEEERLRAAGVSYERLSFEGGHELDAGILTWIFTST